MDCVICGGKDFTAWGRQGAYEILRCRACGLGLTSPAPSAAELAEFNRGAYSGEERAAVYASRWAELRKRYAYIVRIKQFKKEGALLDVGCNIGTFMKVARDEGFAVTGVEMNAGCAAYGREWFSLDIRSSSLDDAAFPAGTFDVVTMFDVLEHVQDPCALVSEVSRALKPDGLLVVQSPNLTSFMAWLLKENWNWLTPQDHLYHFTPGALSRLLKDGGFTVVEMRTWEPARDFTGNIYSGFLGRGTAGRALRKLLWLAALALVPLLQRFWWKLGWGGLVEIYALKNSG
ncbi:MAG: class I SAM-dependent methyltransferase [Syntrophales bacterium]